MIDDAPAARAPQSAIVLLVPEAADSVGPHRARLDPRSADGIPEHITILYPFLPPDALTADVMTQLGDLIATVPAFDYALTEVRWFGRELMWLAPEPAETFVTLTQRVADAFGTPPYAGKYPEITPHLTVATAQHVDAARVAESVLQAMLPLHARAHRCLLVTSDGHGTWSPRQELAFGAQR